MNMETTWKVDNAHSEVGFKVKHMMITNVSGSFETFDAVVSTSGDDFSTAQFKFSADIDSITTGVGDRDAHLKSDDFFNAEAFPQLTFASSSVKFNGDEDVVIEGEMTIRDITKPIVLQAEFGGIVVDPYGQTKAGLTVTGKIKRSEFGLKWNAITEAGSIVVSDEIRLNVELQFIKQS